MYLENQPTTIIQTNEVVSLVTKLSKENYRLVQMHCTQVGADFEVNYTFDKEYQFKNLRLMVPASNLTVPSVTGAFLCAFTYENEIHDLFGITFTGCAIDFKGTFYKKSELTPFVKKINTNADQ